MATKYLVPFLGTGNNDGSSFANAFQSFIDVNNALNISHTISAGDTIIIKNGSYSFGTSEILGSIDLSGLYFSAETVGGVSFSTTGAITNSATVKNTTLYGIKFYVCSVTAQMFIILNSSNFTVDSCHLEHQGSGHAWILNANGGNVAQPTYIKNTIINVPNQSSSSQILFTQSVNMSFCTIAVNGQGFYSGQSGASLNNSIVYSPNTISMDNNTVATTEYNNLFYSAADPTGSSISLRVGSTSTKGKNPLFVDPSSNNYSLRPNSPCKTLGVTILAWYVTTPHVIWCDPTNFTGTASDSNNGSTKALAVRSATTALTLCNPATGYKYYICIVNGTHTSIWGGFVGVMPNADYTTVKAETSGLVRIPMPDGGGSYLFATYSAESAKALSFEDIIFYNPNSDALVNPTNWFWGTGYQFTRCQFLNIIGNIAPMFSGSWIVQYHECIFSINGTAAAETFGTLDKYNLTNCIITYRSINTKTSLYSGTPLATPFTNCIIADNSNRLTQDIKHKTCYFSGWATSPTIGTSGSIIGTDPQYIDPANGNFALRPNSPCKQGGTSGRKWYETDTDFIGWINFNQTGTGHVGTKLDPWSWADIANQPSGKTIGILDGSYGGQASKNFYNFKFRAETTNGVTIAALTACKTNSNIATFYGVKFVSYNNNYPIYSSAIGGEYFNVTLDTCYIETDFNGARLEPDGVSGSAFSIRNCLLVNKQPIGQLVYGYTGVTTLSFENNTVILTGNSSIPLYGITDNKILSFKNNIFYSNVALTSLSNISISVERNNNFWSPSGISFTPAATSSKLDPQFIDPTNSIYSLRPKSPCKNKGALL